VGGGENIIFRRHRRKPRVTSWLGNNSLFNRFLEQGEPWERDLDEMFLF
jgi:hypothetical protein